MGGGSVTLWRAEDAPHVSNFTGAFPAEIARWLASRTPRVAGDRVAPTAAASSPAVPAAAAAAAAAAAVAPLVSGSLEPPGVALMPAALQLRLSHEAVPEGDTVVPF